MRDKITVIGSLNYDIILKCERLPEKGETMPVEDASFTAGGKGANQAVQAAKLGVETYMVGCVGEDAPGAYLTQTAENYGLHTEYIRMVSGVPSGTGVVSALKDGGVHASIVRGANFEITKEDVDKAENILKESEIVILQNEIPLDINVYAIDKAKECGCKVLLNAAPAMEMPEEALAKCDIIVANEVEAAFYLGRDVAEIEAAKAGTKELSERFDADIIITLGVAGAVVSDKGAVSFIPSKKVDAIESTGAGDSFIGGVGYALMQGRSLTDACSFAACCSALTVCRMGAQDAMPTLDEVRVKANMLENRR